MLLSAKGMLYLDSVGFSVTRLLADLRGSRLGMRFVFEVGLSARLVMGLMVGPIVGLMAGIFVRLLAGLAIGLLVGLAVGLTVGIRAGLIVVLIAWFRDPNEIAVQSVETAKQ
jgi:hypothetical protein